MATTWLPLPVNKNPLFGIAKVHAPFVHDQINHSNLGGTILNIIKTMKLSIII